MIPEEEWFNIALLEPEPFKDGNGRRNRDRPDKRLIDNLTTMIRDHDRWYREDDTLLAFKHDTGLNLQMRRQPKDPQWNPSGQTLARQVAIWLDGMKPFRVTLEEKNDVMGLYQAVLLKEARPSIERVGVLAALCAP